MKTQKRTIRVWLSLVVATALTTGILCALQPEKGISTQFSLSSYYVNSAYPLDVLSINSSATPFKWRGVSVEFSGTEAGNVSTLAMTKNLTTSDFLNYHFVVCNGYLTGGPGTDDDGLIQSTLRWENQDPCTEEGDWQNTTVVRICVIGKGFVTEKQRKSVMSLIDGICRNSDIPADRVVYR